MTPVNKLSTEFKSIDKEDRIYFIGDQINDFVKDYIANMTRNRVIAEKYIEFFSEKKVAKTLAKVAKAEEFKVTPMIAIMLADTLKTMSRDKDSESVVPNIYLDIISELFAKKAKNLSKKTDIDRTVLMNILMEYPVPGDGKSRCNYTLINRLLRKIYVIEGIGEKLTPDNIHILFNNVIGSDIIRFVFNILLERKQNATNLNDEQIVIWNSLTKFALETINDIGKKSEVAEAIQELYIGKREKDFKMGNDYERRICLDTLSDEYYPKIVKACALLVEKNENSKKFL